MNIQNGSIIKAAIFDVDGTLLDSMYLWEDAGEILLRNHNLEAPEDLRRQLGPLTLRQTAAYFNEHYHLHDTEEEMMEEICKLVEDAYFYQVPEKPYVREALQWFFEHGVALSILTASERYHVEAACRRLGILGYFKKIYTCTELGLSKNEPALFAGVLRDMGVEPGEAVMFEDSLHALKTAAACGMITAAVADTYNREQTEKLRETADFFISDYREVPKLFEDLHG